MTFVDPSLRSRYRSKTSNFGPRPSDGKDLDLQAQLATCRYDVYAQGDELVQELVDRDASGQTLDRPGLDLLRAYVRSEEIDVIVVVHLARLTCNIEHLRMLWAEFQAAGVDLRAVRYDTSYGDTLEELIPSINYAVTKFERALFAEPAPNEGLSTEA